MASGATTNNVVGRKPLCMPRALLHLVFSRAFCFELPPPSRPHAHSHASAAFCWGSCPQLPAPPATNDAAPASADLSPGSKAALAIFFITYFANIAGVWFYCREKAVNMPLPLVSAVVGWILCWVYILFVLPAMNKQKMQDRANLQNRML